VTFTLPPLTDHDLAAVSASFEHQPAEAVVAWAIGCFGDRVCVTTSMTDAVLVDVACRVKPGIEVVFIDTGLHFAETLEMAERVRRRYPIELRMEQVPRPPVPFHVSDPVSCCSTAKVAALDTALEGKLAWMSGLRRADGPSRSDAPIVSRDGRGLVKLNPLATWTDDDVSDYVARHDVPVNPLVARGYLSIGCRPCTRPVPEGATARSGRWDGVRTECGLHLD
jgi:phosphoadenosine phosphosulfate reductase